MPKATLTYLLIYSIVFVTLTATVTAQVAVQSPPTPAKTAQGRPDLKTAIALDTKRHDDRSAEPDVRSIERDATKLPNKPTFWTKKNTALVVLAAVGLAALVFVLIKYGKDCLKTDPANCALGTDEICTCTEYAPRK